MATAGVARALRPPRGARRLWQVAVVAAVAALTFAVVTSTSTHGLLVAAFVGVGLAVCLYLFIEQRAGRTMLALLLYLTLLDGSLKLATGSQLVLLGRDILLLAIVGGMLTRAIVARRVTIPPLTGLIVFYVGIVLVQLGNPEDAGLVHSLGGIRPHLEFVPLFFVGFFFFRSARTLRVFFAVLIAVAAVNGFVALVQYQLTPAQLAAWGPGYEKLVLGTGDVAARVTPGENGREAKVRPPALGSDVGFGGGLAVFATPGAIALLVLRRQRSVRLLAATFGGGILLALLTSQARISIVLAAVGALAYVGLSTLSRRRLQNILGIAAAALIVWIATSVIASEVGTTVFERYRSIAPNEVFQTAFDYKKATFTLTGRYLGEWPLGAGIGSVGPGATFAGAPKHLLDGESELNFLLVELGYPGLLFIVLFVLSMIVLAFRRIPVVEDDDVRPLLAAVAAGLTALLVGFAGAPITAGVPGGPFLWLSTGTLTYWLIHRPKLLQRERLRRRLAL